MESLHRDSSHLVTRKLVSALATFFFRFHHLWPRYLAHLAICLATDRTRPPLDSGDEMPMDQLLQSLEIPKIQAVVWIASHIVEDASRLDMNSAAK